MAEGLLRAAAGDVIDVVSAGSKPTSHLNVHAVQMMKEIGIDISGHRSKSMNEFLNSKIDTVITVCGNADQACPTFPGQMNRHHWGFDDPAHAKGTEEEILAEFRRVRDQIALVFRAYASGLKEGRSFASH